jgi:hypothetical protein
MSPWIILTAALSFGQVSEPTPPPPFEAARFRTHAAYLASDALQGRLPGSQGSARAADYIVGQLKSAGASPQGDRGDFVQQFRREGTSGRNLLAVFPGQGTLTHQAVVVCAHYDHLGTKPVPPGEDGIYNGADDDASGVAAILLIAEAYGRDRDRAAKPRRSVIFAAFDREERGMTGSVYYREHPTWPLRKTYAAMNFDGMGRPQENRVYAGDISCAPLLQRRITALGEACGLSVETRLGGIVWGDHAMFRHANIPAFMLFTGLHADYHRVTDEVDKLDCAGAARIAWLGYRMLTETIADPTPLTFERFSPRYDVGNALRLAYRLGAFPNLGAQTGPYLTVSGVAPGSAADQCGFRAGDQVTAVNGQALHRMEDALLVAPQPNLSAGLRVRVLRKDKTLDLFVPGKWFENVSGPRARPLADGKYELTFVYRPHGRAKALYLAGTFNDWKPTALKMDGPDKDGRFTTRLVLNKGVYEYKFVLDGKSWEADPQNVCQTDAFQNNVLFAGIEP